MDFSGLLLTKQANVPSYNFIDYIKGIFVILIFSEDKFYIYSDRLGIRKFFYHISNDTFLMQTLLP